MSTPHRQVTKRELGESYLVGTGVVLGLVLVWKLLVEGPEALLWAVVGLVPVLALVAPVRWLHRLDMTGEQVWRVAECSALALGVGVLLVVALDYVTRLFVFSAADTFLLATSLATLTAAGALVGVVRELERATRRLTLRNTVLHRVLRHNLRNDMTVVLCLLDDLEAGADPDQRETLARVRTKVEGLVGLTDKVRRMNVAASDGRSATEAVDLVALVDSRVRHIRETYPDITIETDLPDRAVARLGGEFGLVLDNVAHCVAAGDGPDPSVYVSVGTDDDRVRLRIEDRNGSLPEADLSAVGTGSETELQHGLGMELWLVYWLVDANGGDLSFETGDVTAIDIELDRAGPGWRPRFE